MVELVALSTRDVRHPLGGGANFYTHMVLSGLRLERKVLISERSHGLDDLEMIDGIEVHRVTPPAHLNALVAARLFKPDLVVEVVDVFFPWFSSAVHPSVPRILIFFQADARKMYYEYARPFAEFGNKFEKFLYLPYRNWKALTISESSERSLIEFGLKSENIVVAEPGVESDYFRYDPKDYTRVKSATPLIVVLSRLRAYKGIQYAIAALPAILRNIPGAKLCVLGFGPRLKFAKSLEHSVEAMGLRDNVSIRYDVPRSERIAILTGAHIMLNPSVSEGWGINILQSNACMTPCVAWNVEGVRDSIKDGSTGRLIPFGNVDEMAEAAVKLLSDRSVLMQMARNAYFWAREHTWDRTVGKAQELINAIL
jgi:glycosyltransferase involved in cell wall biosynthesis